MEKNVSSLKILNIVLCTLILFIFVIFGSSVKAEEINQQDEVLPSNNIKLGQTYRELIKINNIELKENKLNKYKEKILYYSKIFGYESSQILDDLNENDLTDKPNFEYNLIEYFFSLNKSKKYPRIKEYIPYTKDSKYIEKLIIYYSQIYENVDPILLLSIGAAESGYYQVDYMLKKNNIYGGISNNKLIQYNNIEIGILTYVRMMSKSYYSKGLTNIYTIGKVYCPVIENGIKKPSNHWIKLVTQAYNKYKNYDKNITFEQIM